MDFDLLERSGGGLTIGDPNERPAWHKAVGIGLAAGSGIFIGISFVMKKVGLLAANAKYNEEAGEGYGYLKNGYWWGGMTLMIIGEICNFVAYAFTDAILVTPLGALTVVVSAVLSAIFLKERLSMVGKVACFLCIVGSVVIVLNAPRSASVKDIQEMKKYAITPAFLSYTGVIIVGSIITAFYAGPRWGKKNMFVYISICSWIGGLSVVSTQGLGSAIIAWIGGKPQYKEWFLWVLLVFVITTLLVEIVYLNKALNIYSAALVTPTYYVYFTSTTLITSAVLFQGFKGTPQSIVTVVLGFLTICSGVVLLQLSQSAKDVPDAAVFKGDLDQIQTIAEQEQPESEPKADAIRGTAAIVRQFSRRRLQMEQEELRRMNEEKKMMEAMEPISENGQPQWEWDGIRRRRTTTLRSMSRAGGSVHRGAGSFISRTTASPPPSLPQTPVQHTTRGHPPLGMSRFPDDYDEYDDHDRGSIFSSIAGTIRGRNRARTNASSLPPYDEQPEYEQPSGRRMQPVPLTEIVVPKQRLDDGDSAHYASPRVRDFAHEDMRYRSGSPDSDHGRPPTPPPHSAMRQFSFQDVFRRSPVPRAHNNPTEEERVGLVREAERDHKEPSRDEGRGLERYDDSDDDDRYDGRYDGRYDDTYVGRYNDRRNDRDDDRDLGDMGRSRGMSHGPAFL